ncbi:Nif11-like leader peptide family RiPP precursor [Leptothoe spongobia]|uniref:Nif11-like leader peptide family RiPP n=1 Tax=Leptothoe spongobia TAU-MAC 1115 TaxID=1967444 RepID=A0A947DCZ2_9CYAN|nr:Nif11-like leader peptide family RiPP precursor [Leptothoe spongobia]MBT9314433.1 Nif11-like leader peptide family RiPP precursor [Leptothoe spongobia TAU-MAC 1115]
MLPNNILEKVKEFLVRLVKDSTFITQLQQRSADQVQSFLQDAGYDFSQDEFESATLKILDLKEQNQFHELSEAELVGAVGGWLRLYPKYSGWLFKRPGRFPIDDPIAQPMYGVVIEPPADGHPVPIPEPPPIPGPQPMYGVVIEPIDGPIFQPMYGVITPPEIL